jgi:phage terminase large subunit-like protein
MVAKRKPKRPKRPSELYPAEEYAWDIREGNIVSCAWIQLMVERYFSDRDREINDPKFKYYFDEESALSSLAFFDFLCHSKGEWAGETFLLEPWELFILWQLFGWLREEDDMRRFRTCYLEIARKNGKTTLAAGVGLYMLDGDNEAGAEVYSAATKKDQAKLSHGEAERMVKSSSFLRDHLTCHTNNIFSKDTNSLFRPLGQDNDTLDGLNTHCALVDEVHAHKTRTLWDVLETSTGSRRQPLMFAITTAGFNRETICFELHDYAQKVLEGSVDDDTFLGIIYTLDIDDIEEGWNNEDNWIKSNPNLGVSVKIDDLRRKAVKAEEVPSALNTFLRLHMNIWTESETRWIPHSTWMEGNSVPINEEELRGRRCCGGLDLSSNKDVTAFVLIFPPDPGEDKYILLPRFFIPKDNMLIRSHRDRVPYDSWFNEGFIFATPGKVVDYSFILDQIDKDTQKFDITEIAFDRWGASKIIQDLGDLGFEKEEDNKYAQRFLFSFGQGYKSMNAPMKELENLITKNQINHGGNPVLAWMASNVVVSEDPAGNVKPNKQKSIEKIDGIVAAIMALDRAIKQKPVFEIIMPSSI